MLRQRRPYGDPRPKTSVMPVVWLALLVVALAILAALWNFLQ